MANFFEDNADLQFLFAHLDLAEIAALQEDGFTRNTGPGGVVTAGVPGRSRPSKR